ncbi:hypothetical protein ACFV7Q_23405 [Streptomyces sp. NPDC059851]|uniref:hypothetical protein n=1 Tax=Streptomyces sp. NPDC059851 TaxID=3346971 RepID=UPI0036556DF5
MGGPLTEGQIVPNYLYLARRLTALARLGVCEALNARLATVGRDYIGSDQERGLLVSAEAWPLRAARTARMAHITRGPEASLCTCAGKTLWSSAVAVAVRCGAGWWA